MILTSEEIRMLLRLLADETVVAPTVEFRFRIVRAVSGYREGAEGRLQAKLSMMLEAATRREGGHG